MFMRMFRIVPNIVCICLENGLEERKWKIDSMDIDNSQLTIGKICTIEIKNFKCQFPLKSQHSPRARYFQMRYLNLASLLRLRQAIE